MKRYDLCDWVEVDPTKFHIAQETVLDPHNISRYDVATGCDEGKQYFHFDLIRCVPLDLIEKRDVWSPDRLKRIRAWARPWSLNSVPYEAPGTCNARGLPSFSREVNIGEALADRKGYLLQKDVYIKTPSGTPSEKKYLITDGIHRTARAKELGLSCILAEVNEFIWYRKEDQENVELPTNLM